MSETPDCKPASDDGCDAQVLPTRQRNALRLLLGKAEISPGEVAKIKYAVLERAPGVGSKSIGIIRAWLNSHGYELSAVPRQAPGARLAQRQRKLERAIDYLRGHGYEVRCPLGKI